MARLPQLPMTDTSDFPSDINAEQKAIISALLDDLNEAVILSELSGHIYYANNAARELFGMKAKAAGRRLDWLLNSKASAASILAVIQSGKEKSVELTWKPEGPSLREPVSLSIHISPVQISSGATLSRLRITTKQDNSSLDKAMDGIWEVVRRLHDPLTLITGYVETLGESGYDDEHSIKKALQTFQKSADRMESSINLLYQRLRTFDEIRKG